MNRKLWGAVLVTILVLVCGSLVARRPGLRATSLDGAWVAATKIRVAAWLASVDIEHLRPPAVRAPEELAPGVVAAAGLGAMGLLALVLARRGRRRLAVRLARRGRPTAAIARRTHLAQDAVRTLTRSDR